MGNLDKDKRAAEEREAPKADSEWANERLARAGEPIGDCGLLC